MAPVITGIAASKQTPAPEEPEWTVEELKAGKPMMVYYFIPVADPAKADCTEVNYKFSRKTEMSAFKDSVDRLNKSWVAKKEEVAADSDHKLEKNQARIEFWSFTRKKMDSITLKNQQVLNPSEFEIRLKELERKNRAVCDAEIKRIQAEAERRKQEDAATAAGTSK